MTHPKQPGGSNRRPTVSVIIPTVDRPDLLDAALASIASQTGHCDIEVVIAHDGGPSILPVIGRWNDSLAIKTTRTHQYRQGAAAARNAAIAITDGEYLAFLDDDDLYLPGHLHTGCQRLRDGDTDLVYLSAVVADRRLDCLPQDLSGFRLKAYPYDHRFLHVANYLHTGSVIVRTFRHTTVRFDESLEVCEDWDLWLALINTLGYRAAHVSQVTSIYHQLPGNSGLVSQAQTASPSKFSVARTYINRKWPSSDPLVLAYRDWMAALEEHRDALIAARNHMPNLLFDEILDYLHGRIRSSQGPDYTHISQFFDANDAVGSPA